MSIIITTILLELTTPTSWKRTILVTTLQRNDPTVDQKSILQAAWPFDLIEVISVRIGMVCDDIQIGRKKRAVAVTKSVSIYDHVVESSHSRSCSWIENVISAKYIPLKIRYRKRITGRRFLFAREATIHQR